MALCGGPAICLSGRNATRPSSASAAIRSSMPTSRWVRLASARATDPGGGDVRCWQDDCGPTHLARPFPAVPRDGCACDRAALVDTYDPRRRRLGDLGRTTLGLRFVGPHRCPRCHVGCRRHCRLARLLASRRPSQVVAPVRATQLDQAAHLRWQRRDLAGLALAWSSVLARGADLRRAPRLPGCADPDRARHPGRPAQDTA